LQVTWAISSILSKFWAKQTAAATDERLKALLLDPQATNLLAKALTPKDNGTLDLQAANKFLKAAQKFGINWADMLVNDAAMGAVRAGNKQTANKKWLLVDAEGQSVGRLASKVAKLIRGKHKTNFTPHADCGDNVIVINAEKIALTGNKLSDKTYIRHTGFPGGQRTTTVKEMLEKHPERIIEKAVRGMLPKNKLGRQLFTNLKVYVGVEHKHQAQNPETFNLNTFN